MKLYYAKGTCSLAVLIALNEVGANFEAVAVNLKTKQTENDENYLTINPKGPVPALQINADETLTENAVIQQYIADTYKATNLLPPLNDFNRYRVLEWLNFVSTDLHKNCSPLFNSALPEAARDIFKNILSNKLKFTDEMLGQKTFLMGEQFTLPDGYLFVILTWLPHLKIDLTQFKNLSRYYSQVKERSSVQKALKQEGF